MQINIRTNKEIGTTPFMKEAVIKKFEHLHRVLPQDSHLDCSCKIENNEKSVKVMVRSSQYNIQAEAKDNDFYNALDEVYRRIHKQVRRLHNEKVTKFGDGITEFELEMQRKDEKEEYEE